MISLRKIGFLEVGSQGVSQPAHAGKTSESLVFLVFLVFSKENWFSWRLRPWRQAVSKTFERLFFFGFLVFCKVLLKYGSRAPLLAYIYIYMLQHPTASCLTCLKIHSSNAHIWGSMFIRFLLFPLFPYAGNLLFSDVFPTWCTLELTHHLTLDSPR